MTYRSEYVETDKPNIDDTMVFIAQEIESMWDEGWQVTHVELSKNSDADSSFHVSISFKKEL